MIRRAVLLLACAALAGCTHGTRPAPDAAASGSPYGGDSLRDGGQRIRTIAEVPPLGPAPDGSQVDVPLAWIHLIADPVGTGTSPTAAVGAAIPCGYEPYFAASERGDGEVRLRLRARRAVNGHGTEGCDHPTPIVQMIALGVLRLGDWRVVDASAHPDGGVARPRTVVQHVVPDDPQHLAPALTRWTRPCGSDGDCTAGGVCAQVGDGAVCVPPVDPWMGIDQPCAAGTLPVEVSRRGSSPVVSWRVCLGACDSVRGCPGGYQCQAQGVCLPAGDGGVPEAVHGSPRPPAAAAAP